MPLLFIRDLPRYECLLEAAREFPDLDPSATAVFLKLLRAGDEMFRVVEANLGGHDITHGRFGVLMALWAHDRRAEAEAALTPAELADRTSVTRATMTGLVNTLERDGLVTREPAAGDRLMTTVRLTDAGRDVIRRILPGHFQLMAALMAPLSSDERQTFSDLLHKVLEQAARITPAGTTAVPNSVAAR